MDKEFKILHAPCGPAGQMGILSRSLRALGYYAYSCVFSNSGFCYGEDRSLSLDKLNNRLFRSCKKLGFFFKAIKEFDIFHFHSGATLLPRGLDLPILKSLNKKVVMHYWGSDIRQKSIAAQKNRFVKVKIGDEAGIRKRIKHISKYVKLAIVADYELYEYIKNYFENVVIIRQAIELQEYIPVIPPKRNRKIVIVHAPSDQGIKGTEYVLKTINRLERNYELEFLLVYGMPHYRVTAICRKADIVVDQLLVGTYGVFATEAMALGKPVICYIREDLWGTYPKELPIISAHPGNLYERLKRLIENPDLRYDLGVKGRNYVEKYHDSLKIAKQLIELYKNL